MAHTEGERAGLTCRKSVMPCRNAGTPGIATVMVGGAPVGPAPTPLPRRVPSSCGSWRSSLAGGGGAGAGPEAGLGVGLALPPAAVVAVLVVPALAEAVGGETGAPPKGPEVEEQEEVEVEEEEEEEEVEAEDELPPWAGEERWSQGKVPPTSTSDPHFRPIAPAPPVLLVPLIPDPPPTPHLHCWCPSLLHPQASTGHSNPCLTACPAASSWDLSCPHCHKPPWGTDTQPHHLLLLADSPTRTGCIKSWPTRPLII